MPERLDDDPLVGRAEGGRDLCLGRLSIGATGDEHVAGDREACGAEQCLGDVFVHRRRATENAAAHEGQTEHGEQALDRAVLAGRAVQHGEDDIWRRGSQPVDKLPIDLDDRDVVVSTS